MSHSKDTKFQVNPSKGYKLSEALRERQALKSLTSKFHCCHNSPAIRKMKYKRRRHMRDINSYSKRLSIQGKSNRNFRHEASKSTKSAKALKDKHTLELLTYYKSLCRSSKCDIHRTPSIERTKKDSRIKTSDSPQTGDDFEETIYSENIDINLFKKIESSVEDMEWTPGSFFKGIIGHSEIRDILNKTVIWPLKKPETFKGLRAAPKGVLLFGPPGTGKTSLVRFIALETNSTFFNVSTSTLSSKNLGECEKLVRVLFLVARARQPSIIFIDEIHGILSEKTKDENEFTKRLKNEFIFCMNSIDSVNKNRIMVIGSTSRPQDLDERIRPKFSKRIHIPLPNENVRMKTDDRQEILLKLLERECHSLELVDIKEVVEKTNGFSISDLKSLCQEAAMISIKKLPGSALFTLRPNKIRPISVEDFEGALKLVKPTVSEEQVKACEYWDVLYGYGEKENTRYFQSSAIKDFYQNNPYVI